MVVYVNVLISWDVPSNGGTWIWPIWTTGCFRIRNHVLKSLRHSTILTELRNCMVSQKNHKCQWERISEIIACARNSNPIHVFFTQTVSWLYWNSCTWSPSDINFISKWSSGCFFKINILANLTHLSLASFLWDISKQCIPRSDVAEGMRFVRQAHDHCHHWQVL